MVPLPPLYTLVSEFPAALAVNFNLHTEMHKDDLWGPSYIPVGPHLIPSPVCSALVHPAWFSILQLAQLILTLGP